MPDAPEAHDGRSPVIRGWGADLERDVPGARYGVVLLFLLVTFVFMAAGPSGAWVPLVTVTLQGATLLAALAASDARPGLVRLAMAVVAIGIAVGVATLFAESTNTRGSTGIVSFLLVGVAPVTIALSIWRRRVIDIRTILGAICIYVLLGMFFAFVYTSIGELGTEPFFAQTRTANTADYLYFSFVTLTTTGYGDLTAAGGLGRACAIMEALIGQLYLVTVLALLVSQLSARGRRDTGTQ